MNKFSRSILLLACAASFFSYGCNHDSGSGSGEDEREFPVVDRCAEEYGFEKDSAWSKAISADSYMETWLCDRLSEYMNTMFSFYARCVSAEYNKSKNRFDIEIITERGEKYIWADVTGCKYKFDSDGDFKDWTSTVSEWGLDECFCKVDNGVTYYRNVSPRKPEESSSSLKAESSSSASFSSSSRWNFDTPESSSSKAKVSSSSFVLTAGDFVKIGSLEWMTRNLDIDVEGSMCYDDDPVNCEKYGRIYTWSAAMGIDPKYDRQKLGEIELPYQGICPEGTHLPSDEEWALLEMYINQDPEYNAYFTNQIGGAYDWKSFYRSEDVETVFWTTTEYEAAGTGYDYEYAWIWAYRKDGSIARSNPHKYMGAYVRCVRGEASVDLLSSSSADESSSSVESSSGEDFTDETWLTYEYPDMGRVEIGDQVWTTKNLEVPMKDSRCYEDDEANCEKYGRLYTWATAMAVNTRFDHEQLGEIDLPYRGICPEGTHIPSEEEWRTLYDYVLSNPSAKENFINQLGGEYEYYGQYIKEGEQALFWSSTEYDVTGTSHEFEYAYLWAYRKDLSVASDNAHKYTAAYVRCIYDN